LSVQVQNDFDPTIVATNGVISIFAKKQFVVSLVSAGHLSGDADYSESLYV
jgi:hypothetical protein